MSESEEIELESQGSDTPETVDDFIEEQRKIKEALEDIADGDETPAYIRSKALKDKIACLREIERLQERKKKEQKANDATPQAAQRKLTDLIRDDPEEALRVIDAHISRLQELRSVITNAANGGST